MGPDARYAGAAYRRARGEFCVQAVVFIYSRTFARTSYQNGRAPTRRPIGSRDMEHVTGAQQITIVPSFLRSSDGESLVNIVMSTHFITNNLLVPRSTTPAFFRRDLVSAVPSGSEAIWTLVTMARDS